MNERKGANSHPSLNGHRRAAAPPGCQPRRPGRRSAATRAEPPLSRIPVVVPFPASAWPRPPRRTAQLRAADAPPPAGCSAANPAAGSGAEPLLCPGLRAGRPPRPRRRRLAAPPRRTDSRATSHVVACHAAPAAARPALLPSRSQREETKKERITKKGKKKKGKGKIGDFAKMPSYFFGN